MGNIAWRMALVVALTGGLIGGSGSTGTAGTAASAERAQGRLEWGSCPPVSAAVADSPLVAKLECANLEVPLDYRRPNGRKISVAVSRLKSENPAKRRGAMLMNPGGPGGSGLDLPLLVVAIGAPQSLLDSYDLIGFDPRGIGSSTPVTCGFTDEQQFQTFPSYPKEQADVAARANLVRALAGQCKDADREGIAPYIQTRNTARDMDRIRAALGERKISYYGGSYGTYLGSVYAHQFPRRTDRFVLDSAVGPDLIWHKEFRLFGLGGELRFPDFAKWAAARHDTYGLGRTEKEVRATYFALTSRLDGHPLPGIDGTYFRWLTFQGLYSDLTFAPLAEAWQEILALPTSARLSSGGAVKRLEQLAGPPPADNATAAQDSILCGDVEWPRSVEGYQRDVAIDRKRFPLFGAMMANMWICQGWPAKPIEQPVRIDDRGPSNILVLQNLRDPATTYPGAVQLRLRFGQRARLVTVDQGGHGVYLQAPNRCASAVATAYLVDGIFPARDVYCGAEPEAAKAPPADSDREAAVLELLSRQRPF